MENPIKVDDLGVPLLLETPISKFFLSFFYPPAILTLGWIKIFYLWDLGIQYAGDHEDTW